MATTTQIDVQLYDAARGALARTHDAGPRRQATALRIALRPVIRRNVSLKDVDTEEILQQALTVVVLTQTEPISTRARDLANTLAAALASLPITR